MNVFIIFNGRWTLFKLQKNTINLGKPEITLESDASNNGWCDCITNDAEKKSMGGN